MWPSREFYASRGYYEINDLGGDYLEKPFGSDGASVTVADSDDEGELPKKPKQAMIVIYLHDGTIATLEFNARSVEASVAEAQLSKLLQCAESFLQ
jgi:hypothetical protein